MAKRYGVLFFALLFLGLWIISTAGTAFSQIIMVNLKVKIVKVERQNNRLQVRVHEGKNKDVQYVEIDSNTRFSANNREITYAQAWSRFRQNMIIRVRGGYTMALHVKAKQIYF